MLHIFLKPKNQKQQKTTKKPKKNIFFSQFMDLEF